MEKDIYTPFCYTFEHPIYALDTSNNEDMYLSIGSLNIENKAENAISVLKQKKS
jgi:hypothetical protein